MNLVNSICLTLVLILAGLSIYNYRKSKNKVYISNKINRKTEWIILSVILFIGIIIRIYNFGEVPGGINQDEAMAGVDAKALSDYGTDRFGTKYPVHFRAWGFGQMSVLMSYLMIPFIKIGGLNFITARLPILISSIFSLLCFYLLIRDVFDNKKALIITAFLVINPWHFMQSRWALDCNMFPHMFIIGLFFLYRSVKLYDSDIKEWKKWINIYISMFFFSLCMYSYGIAFYTVPFFLLISCIYLYIKKIIKFKHILISFLIYSFFSWPIYMVMIINTFQLNAIETPFFTIPFFEGSIRSKDILFFSDAPFSQLLSNLKALLNVIILQNGNMPGNSIRGFGIIYLCSLPLLIIGIVYLIIKNRKTTDVKNKAGFFMLFLFLIIGVIAGIITRNVNINRINIIIYPLIIFTGLGICFVINYAKRFKYAVALPYAVLFVMFMHSYFTRYADFIKEQFYGHFDDALFYSKNIECDKYYITPWIRKGVNLPHVSEIITLFCLEVDSKYFQGETNIINGKENLPYNEKYTYISPDEIEDIDPESKTVYIISTNHSYLFSDEYFYIKEFNGFCTVIPLWMYKDKLSL